MLICACFGAQCPEFTVTAWGIVPGFDQLQRDFPGLVREPVRDERLRAKLARWGG